MHPGWSELQQWCALFVCESVFGKHCACRLVWALPGGWVLPSSVIVCVLGWAWFVLGPFWLFCSALRQLPLSLRVGPMHAPGALGYTLWCAVACRAVLWHAVLTQHGTWCIGE
jgi:hypothetical protein